MTQHKHTWALCSLLLLWSCATPQPELIYPPPLPPDPNTAQETPKVSDSPVIAQPAKPPCPAGRPCNPINITGFPFEDERDTSTLTESIIDSYGCAPDKDQSGAEVIYTFELTQRSVVAIELDDEPGDDTDIDLHLLTEIDAERCRDRHNKKIQRLLQPGRYYIIADTYVDPSGTIKSGPYKLTVALAQVPEAVCRTRTVDMEMRWKECAPDIDCEERERDNGDTYRVLHTPALGPVVREAHLVTIEDGFDEGVWPDDARHQIDAHYERARNYMLPTADGDLNQPWAPAGEGGSRWGQGSTGRPVPAEAETWYITMNWAKRPAPGTRMIVTNPTNGKAVVAAAGYETGPGSPTAIAGVSEEIHQHLGTTHRDPLMVAFAQDQSLPFGPVHCIR